MIINIFTPIKEFQKNIFLQGCPRGGEGEEYEEEENSYLQYRKKYYLLY